MKLTSVDPFGYLRDRVLAAVRAAYPDAEATDAALHRSAHADYQADVALALARRLGKPPREVAAAVAQHLTSDDVLASVAVSGPGFLNLTLTTAFLDRALAQMLGDERLGVPLAAPSAKVIVDY